MKDTDYGLVFYDLCFAYGLNQFTVERTITELSCSSKISSVEGNATRVLCPMLIEVGPNKDMIIRIHLRGGRRFYVLDYHHPVCGQVKKFASGILGWLHGLGDFLYAI